MLFCCLLDRFFPSASTQPIAVALVSMCYLAPFLYIAIELSDSESCHDDEGPVNHDQASRDIHVSVHAVQYSDGLCRRRQESSGSVTFPSKRGARVSAEPARRWVKFPRAPDWFPRGTSQRDSAEVRVREGVAGVSREARELARQRAVGASLSSSSSSRGSRASR